MKVINVFTYTVSYSYIKIQNGIKIRNQNDFYDTFIVTKIINYTIFHIQLQDNTISKKKKNHYIY